jgi:GT2 family glycosyltransferase
MSQPLVTILVPHYKTLDLTKLCLRLLRKYTDSGKAQVMVIDNDSQDDSLPYLRSLSWITLIERQAVSGETPVMAHSRALDLALEQVTTPYVLSIHTDTLVKRSDWLEFLLSEIKKRPTIAGVGSWKLEEKPLYKRLIKQIERYAQLGYYQLIGRKQHAIQGVGDNYYYLRSHCALYRMDLLKKFGLSFSAGDKVAGKTMHKSLVDAGYEMIFLPSETLIRYLDHVNHATVVLNPHLSSRQKSVDKGLRRIEKSLARLGAETILQDASLDR